MNQRDARKQTKPDVEDEELETESELASVDTIIGHVQTNLLDTPTTMTDLIRLLELRRELKEADPGKLTVKWIDECVKPEREE